MKLDSAVLYTNNIQRVVDFYQGMLGLEIDSRVENKFVRFKFANGIGLSIKKAVEEREVPGLQTIFIASNDMERDYELVKRVKVVMNKDLVKESWGKQFSIFDPDGNKVVFIERK